MQVREQIYRAKKARELVKSAQKVYVTQIVQVECSWVLAKVYKIGKPGLLNVLDHLLNNPAYILQRSETFETALDLFRQSQADFADCLILAESHCAETILHTFDKRLGKHSDTRLL
jgi:predicted nucleic-acid-binding protein